MEKAKYNKKSLGRNHNRSGAQSFEEEKVSFIEHWVDPKITTSTSKELITVKIRMESRERRISLDRLNIWKQHHLRKGMTRKTSKRTRTKGREGKIL